MKIMIYLLGFLMLCTSCQEEDNKNDGNINEILNQNLEIKNKLIGSWVEISPCDSCNTLMFTENDTITQRNKWNDSPLYAYYQVIAEDSIKVTREWEIEDTKKTTKHKLIFYSNDSLEIKQFFPVDYGITGFEDVKLYKTN